MYISFETVIFHFIVEYSVRNMFPTTYIKQLMLNQLKISIKLARLIGLIPFDDEETSILFSYTLRMFGLMFYSFFSFILMKQTQSIKITNVLNILNVCDNIFVISYILILIINVIHNKTKKWQIFFNNLQLYTKDCNKIEFLDAYAIFSIIVVIFVFIIFKTILNKEYSYSMWAYLIKTMYKLYLLVLTIDVFFMRSVLKRFKYFYTETNALLNEILVENAEKILHVHDYMACLEIREIGKRVRIFSKIVEEYDGLVGIRIPPLLAIVFSVALSTIRNISMIMLNKTSAFPMTDDNWFNLFFLLMFGVSQ